ncbi:MAG TPA: polysaccharide biosynthesis tyrosine autokinase [Ktedonobacteraceae bacterium]
MQDPLNRYLMLGKRWAWVILLGVVICGGMTYVLGKFTKPTYQATATFVVNESDPFSSIQAAPSYAQLLTNPLVLDPVVEEHKGMTLQSLNAMITVKAQTNTQIVELDVQSRDPRLAAQVANEIGQSYLLYANSHLQGTLDMLPAQVPSDPISPKPLHDAGIAALIGLGLAVALIVIFEWVEDRLSSPENAQELIAQELLVIIPRLPKQQKSLEKGSTTLMEKYRMLAASLNSVQTIKPFKVVMVTSSLPEEGKSTVAGNLACFLAISGKRVLLIDANLHDPVLDQSFQIDNSRGLSTMLLEMRNSLPLVLYSQATDIPLLRVLTSGTAPIEETELLQPSLVRQLFEYLQETPFDYVIVDSPPLLSVADAHILASFAQAVLLVVDANKTPRRVLLRAKQLLSGTRTRILGIILNKSPWPDYKVSRKYPGKKTQRQENPRLLIPPAESLSQPVILMPSYTPVPESRNNLPHTSSGM